MRKFRYLTISSVLILILVLALCPGCGKNKTEENDDNITKQDVVEFVDDAVEFAKKNGREKALKVFSDPKGEFTRGDLYIYAYDFNCVVIAHGGDPSLIGSDFYNYKDPTGFLVIQHLAAAARNGSGWVDYMWENPETKKQQKKAGYVKKVDDTWFLGSGMYD